MKRRQFLTAAAAVSTSPLLLEDLSFTVPSGASPAVDAGQGYVRWQVPTDAVVERFGEPSWIIETDGDRSESLATWAERDDDRHIVREAHIDEWHAALVATPQRAAHDLLDAGWVESLDLDIEMSLADPVRPPTEGSLGLDNVGQADRFLLRGGVNPFRSTIPTTTLSDGVAYRDDMPEATVEDAKDQTNAVDTTADHVAVILDTGVTSDEEVFAGGLFDDTRIRGDSMDYTSEDRPTVEDEGTGVVRDENGHGNWVASAVAGEGNPSGYTAAEIMALRVLDEDGSGSSYDIAEAVRYAASQLGDGGVACLSLGSPVYSHTLDQAIGYAAGAGMPCVVAAGNSRESARWVSSPADSSDAIAVGAVTAEPADEAQSAAFSQHGPDSGSRNLSGGDTAGADVDIAAPGCELLVETPEGERRLTGTSMAAPCVAGGVLQLLAEDSSLGGDIDAIRERLTDHARPIPAAGTTEVGAGMLDIEAAVSETDVESDQESERDAEAEQRDEAHERLSDGEGGFIFRRL